MRRYVIVVFGIIALGGRAWAAPHGCPAGYHFDDDGNCVKNGGGGSTGGGPGPNFFIGADGAPITNVSFANGIPVSASNMGYDGITRSFAVSTSVDDIYASDGEYAATATTTRWTYSDSSGWSIDMRFQANTDGSGASVTVMTSSHWYKYEQAGNNARAYLDGRTWHGTVAQVRASIPYNSIPEVGKLAYFNNIYSLMWNMRNHPGDPNNWTNTPGWNQYAGDGFIGIAVAAVSGATGWGAVITVVAIPLADAWQNEPALQSNVNWLGNILLCAAIEGLDSYLSDTNALTDPTSLYNQAGCYGY
jgi:hypothetical protein